jgi:uncharacterized membrane protein
MKNKIKIALLFSGLLLVMSSCTSVKEYQKMALNDKDMKLSDKKIKVYETNFQSYREGASGAGGGKAGGGCGCN